MIASICTIVVCALIGWVLVSFARKLSLKNEDMKLTGISVPIIILSVIGFIAGLRIVFGVVGVLWKVFLIIVSGVFAIVGIAFIILLIGLLIDYNNDNKNQE